MADGRELLLIEGSHAKLEFLRRAGLKHLERLPVVFGRYAV
jgi:hypothetical protein